MNNDTIDLKYFDDDDDEVLIILVVTEQILDEVELIKSVELNDIHIVFQVDYVIKRDMMVIDEFVDTDDDDDECDDLVIL